MKRPRPAVLTAAKEPPTGAVRAAAVAIAAEIEVVEFVADHWTVAADAFLAYGKGRHRADLNFGDCMTYAIAKLGVGRCCAWAVISPPRILNSRNAPMAPTVHGTITTQAITMPASGV